MASEIPTAIIAAMVALFLCGYVQPRCRQALADGGTCLARYPIAWQLPAFCGLTYGLFQLAATLLLLLRGEDDIATWLTDVQTHPAPPALELLSLGWRPALDTTGTTFHLFTLTFPISALFALRFLLNVDGVLGELRRSLTRRLPILGICLVLGLVSSAIAASAKPFVFLLLPELTSRFPHPWIFTASGTINLIATAFEILLDLFLLTYFTLVAHLWMRGSRLDHRSLVHLSARRLGRLAPWGLIVLALAFVCVLAPQLAVWLFELPPTLAESINTFVHHWGQPIFATLLLLTAAVPVTLIFRNAKLAIGIAAALRFTARNLAAILPFLAFAFIGNLALAAARTSLTATFGYESSAAFGGRCVLAVAQGIFAGWLVVSWACLYKSCSTAARPTLPPSAIPPLN